MDIDDRSTVTLEQLTLKLFVFVNRRLRWRPVRVQHPQQSMDRAGIPRSPWARVPGQGAMSLFEAIQLCLDKALYVCRSGRFDRNALLLQIAKELASRRHVAGNTDAVVAILLQMRAEV